MILITGATGTIGRAVLAELTQANETVRALIHSAPPAGDIGDVQAVAGSFEDPSSLRRAMEGVRAAFLLTPGGPASAPADAALVDAARAAGVEKLVKLSSIGSGTPQVAGADWHAAGEQRVRDSGLAWTIVRPSAYASNALRWANPIRAGQPVPNLTGAATQGIVDPRDVAAVVARALTDADHDGRTHTLTGPHLLSTGDQVATLELLLGRAIAMVDVPLETARQGMIDMGVEPERTDAMIRGLAIIGEGHNAVLTDEVERILGRPARSFEDWATDHLREYTSTANAGR